jgi:hypothetical protein
MKVQQQSGFAEFELETQLEQADCLRRSKRGPQAKGILASLEKFRTSRDLAVS